jgi:hypothetical protein
VGRQMWSECLAPGGSFDLLLGRRTYDIWSAFLPKAPSSPITDSMRRLSLKRDLDNGSKVQRCAQFVRVDAYAKFPIATGRNKPSYETDSASSVLWDAACVAWHFGQIN